MILQVYILITLWCMYWSSEAGQSLPWSSKWQTNSFLQKLPELVLAATVSTVGIVALPLGYVWVQWLLGFAVAWAGIEAATWAMLQWVKHKPRNPYRESTIRPAVDWLAGNLGWTVGDEGYSWTWAAVKGAVMTAPIGFTGIILFPLGNELGSHAKGRLPGDPNMWKELAGGLGIGLSCVLALMIGL